MQTRYFRPIELLIRPVDNPARQGWPSHPAFSVPGATIWSSRRVRQTWLTGLRTKNVVPSPGKAFLQHGRRTTSAAALEPDFDTTAGVAELADVP